VVDINGNKAPWDSPCVNVCSTSIGVSVCIGCGRTVEEIRVWGSLSRDERIEINERVKE